MTRRNILIGVVALAFLVYSLASVHSMYLNGSWQFYDLGLINDFLSNTIRGKFFYVSELNLNHLIYHFSPTLLLLTPFYRIFDSQVILPILGVVLMTASLIVMTEILDTLLDSLPSYQGRIREFLPAIFILILCTNIYTISIVTSAHFEVLFTFLSLVLFYSLIHNASWKILGPLLLLTLGIRNDTGYHLFFTLLLPFLFPAGILKEREKVLRKALILSILSVAYLGFVVLFIQFWFKIPKGFHTNSHWSEFGTTWFEILWTMITSPGRVLREVMNSAIVSLNLSVLFLPILNPLAFLWNTLQGLLFYIGNSPAKKLLFYYNSALLLPGVLISTALSIRLIFLTWNKYSSQNLSPIFRRFLNSVRFAALSLVLVGVLFRLVHLESNYGGVGFKIYPIDSSRSPNLISLTKKILSDHPEIRKISTDSKTFVFLPNSIEKTLLTHFDTSDLVILTEGADIFPDEKTRQAEVTADL